MSHKHGHNAGAGPFMVCDACGRGPNGRQRVFVLGTTKRRSHDEVLRWARRAGRRIGLEIKADMLAAKRWEGYKLPTTEMDYGDQDTED